METITFLHMNKGLGKASYAKNSSFQKYVISELNSVISEALSNIFDQNVPYSIGIADLGCSSGPNSLMAISSVVERVHFICYDKGIEIPELRITLNDLTNNDFNNVFSFLSDFYNELKLKTGLGPESCFISGVAGSFYGRLLPKKSLHLVVSSMSLHWLSKVPYGLKGENGEHLNPGTLYVSEKSSDRVVKAYLSQFQTDFYTFLRCRSDELVTGGRIVFSLMGRSFPNKLNIYQHELIDIAVMSMASEGLIEYEAIDSLNVPFYPASMEEVKEVIEKEGSFGVNEIKAIEVDWEDIVTVKGKEITKAMRAVFEGMFTVEFGREVIDELFTRLTKIVDASVARTCCVLVVSLTRL